MAKESSAKFISRNRKPRVHIEYSPRVGDATEKVELPFVMGVLADLSGDANKDLPPIKERDFVEIDDATFDAKMKAMKPRVEFTVPNALTGEGNLPIDITFESMDDFSPAAIARKVEPLNKLLEQRTQLKDLRGHIDGRDKAEKLIADLLENPALMRGIAAAAKKDKPE